MNKFIIPGVASLFSEARFDRQLLLFLIDVLPTVGEHLLLLEPPSFVRRTPAFLHRITRPDHSISRPLNFKSYARQIVQACCRRTGGHV